MSGAPHTLQRSPRRAAVTVLGAAGLAATLWWAVMVAPAAGAPALRLPWLLFRRLTGRPPFQHR